MKFKSLILFDISVVWSQKREPAKLNGKSNQLSSIYAARLVTLYEVFARNFGHNCSSRARMDQIKKSFNRKWLMWERQRCFGSRVAMY